MTLTPRATSCAGVNALATSGSRNRRLHVTLTLLLVLRSPSRTARSLLSTLNTISLIISFAQKPNLF